METKEYIIEKLKGLTDKLAMSVDCFTHEETYAYANWRDKDSYIKCHLQNAAKFEAYADALYQMDNSHSYAWSIPSNDGKYIIRLLEIDSKGNEIVLHQAKIYKNYEVTIMYTTQFSQMHHHDEFIYRTNNSKDNENILLARTIDNRIGNNKSIYAIVNIFLGGDVITGLLDDNIDDLLFYPKIKGRKS